MKKLEVISFEELNIGEKEVFEFFDKLDLEIISKISVFPQTLNNRHHTIFYFETKENQQIKFLYKENKKVYSLRIWGEISFLGEIFSEGNKKKEKWMTSIWDQFVEHFNLRIRLMFINETTPWRWGFK